MQKQIKQYVICIMLTVSTHVFGDFYHTLIHQQSNEDKIACFLSMVSDASVCTNDTEVLDQALKKVVLDGKYLEMGVFAGRTINHIASKVPNVTIHGFDSFEGLPENWTRDDTTMFCKGFFAMNNFPSVALNVKLYKGWFIDSLPIFKKDILQEQPIAFLHIDCDLYSSTKTVFDILGNNIVNGTVIVFDELYRYPGFEHHEIKALYEFLKYKKYQVKYLAYNIYHEQVAVQIVA
ncbi:MAG: hypothetical protein CL947_01450 [Epsilonproteobacteria bacterium]|nr:hypothetical protein [Campylobacterota bacterium]